MDRGYTRLLLLAGMLLALPLAAQWFDYPTRGVPRTPDGKPNLNAPAPRTADGKPDLSGMWRAANRLPCDGVNRVCGDLPISAQFGNIGAGVEGGLPYQQWVRDRIRQKGPADDPYTRCIAPGGPRMHMLPTMKKWVQSPDLLIILDEYNASTVRSFSTVGPFRRIRLRLGTVMRRATGRATRWLWKAAVIVMTSGWMQRAVPSRAQHA